MGMDISESDLVTMRKLKNTDTSHLHIDQQNIPCTEQVSVVANKQSAHQVRVSYFTTQQQNSFKTCLFGALNNGEYSTNLTSTNVSKLLHDSLILS